MGVIRNIKSDPNKLIPVTVAKFGGSSIGVDGILIPQVIERIKQMTNHTKVVAVFSAPLIMYEDQARSMTDVAIMVGISYASSNPVEIDVLREVYERIAAAHVSKNLRDNFLETLDKFYRHVVISLKQATENKRFVDVARSRTLAYSGEITMSYLMDYIMRSHDIKSDHISIEKWPIITDDNFEAANFMVEESRQSNEHLIDLVASNDVVSMGGFIGKTTDGLETTYERGGSDRTATDIAILLHDNYDIQVDFEKDSAVLSADPKEINDNNLDIPMVITDTANPSNITTIQKNPPLDENNLLKIVTGKRNCAIVRMESIAASHLIASIERDTQYHDFVKLSPYKKDDTEISRLLFLDADYVRRQERRFKAYYPKVEVVYGRGVVTLIGDQMWRMPKIASTATSTVGDHDINIINLDAQEETSRILIVVEDKSNNVRDAIRAIHARRSKIHDSVVKQYG